MGRGEKTLFGVEKGEIIRGGKGDSGVHHPLSSFRVSVARPGTQRRA